MIIQTLESEFWGCPDCGQEPYWCSCGHGKNMVLLIERRTIERPDDSNNPVTQSRNSSAADDR